MTGDLALDLAADGATKIKLTLTDPAGRKVLTRAVPSFDADQLNALRRGQSPEAAADAVSEAISSWLLGTDLAKRLTKALSGQEQLRVAVRVNRDLLPLLSD